MSPTREQLYAFLATLGALLVVYIGTLVIAANYPAIMGKLEAFGLGTITGGLIGILRIPTQRSVTVDNVASDPVPTTEVPPGPAIPDPQTGEVP